jgi:hypothetical protein
MRQISRGAPKVLFHVVQYSGGLGSWATAKRVKEEYGTLNLQLLFADTLIEDDDLYRFLIESSADIFDQETPQDLVLQTQNIPSIEYGEDRKKSLLNLATSAREAIPGLIWISEGRDPWEVFFDRKFLGNSRVDPCSDVLKRKFLRKWMEKNHNPRCAVAYIGIDWTEEHRLKRAADSWKPWEIRAPLCEPPLRAKAAFEAELEARGIAVPRLYGVGFPHNNCGGFCIKAGMAHFSHLAKTSPKRYAYHESREQELRSYLGKDVAILRDRTKEARAANDGKPRPMTLRELRVRLEDGGEIDSNEWGGCGCAI